MPKIKLTSAFCRDITCPPGKRKEVYRCTETTGFGLEVRISSKTYWLYYTSQAGKACQIKLGGYTDITFDQAKRKAKDLRSSITLGGDPTAQKAEKKAIPTYAELSDKHLAHARTYQRRPECTERIVRCHLMPRWGKKRLDEITSHDVAEWLAGLRQSGLAPATVEKIRITMNRSFVLGAKLGVPGADKNPVQSVPRLKFNNKKERFLTAQEADRLVKACTASTNPQLGFIVQMLLLTGARKMELLRAKWEHVNLEQKVWHIPDTKTGVPRYVPLSQDALDIMAQLPRYPGCPWCFPNPDTREPFTDIKKAFTTARKAAGLPDLRIHDLRHSAASFMINSGVNLYAVGSVLGHADYQSTQRYAHLANDTLRAAVEAGAAKMRGGKAA